MVTCADGSGGMLCLRNDGQQCPDGALTLVNNGVGVCTSGNTGSVINTGSGFTICGLTQDDIPSCPASEPAPAPLPAPVPTPTTESTAGDEVTLCDDVDVGDSFSCTIWCSPESGDVDNLGCQCRKFDATEFGYIPSNRCNFQQNGSSGGSSPAGPVPVLAPSPAPPVPPSTTPCDSVPGYGEISNNGECTEACDYFDVYCSGFGSCGSNWQYLSVSNNGNAVTTSSCTCGGTTQICSLTSGGTTTAATTATILFTVAAAGVAAFGY